MGVHALTAAIFVAAVVADMIPAVAQTLPGLPTDEWFVPQTRLVDPQVDRDAETIREQTYRSTPVGQQQHWNLDIGHFSQDISDEPVDLRDRVADQPPGFSGLRLRLTIGDDGS